MSRRSGPRSRPSGRGVRAAGPAGSALSLHGSALSLHGSAPASEDAVHAWAMRLAWLVLAHLAADFLFQTESMVADKFTGGRRGWRGLLAHAAAVGLCLVPVALAFGIPGLGLLVIVTVGHALIDRWKVRATRRAEGRALAAAHRRHEAADRRATARQPRAHQGAG